MSLLVALSTILFAAAWIGVARTVSLAPMTLWTLALGISVSPLFVLTETLLQVSTPEDFRGRVFAAREVLTKTSFLLMSSVATVTATFVSKEVIMMAVGLVLAGMAMLLVSKNFLRT